jgi:hypothetical protein
MIAAAMALTLTDSLVLYAQFDHMTTGLIVVLTHPDTVPTRNS